MKNKILIALVLLLAAFLFWWFSATQVLTRRSASLLETVRFEDGTGRVERSFKADKLRDLIADNVTVNYPSMPSAFQDPHATSEPITLTQDLAKSALLYLTEVAEWITVENESIEVLEIEENTAKVKISFDLKAKLKRRKEQSATLNGEFIFRSIEDKWLLTNANFE